MFKAFEFISIWWTFPAISISFLLMMRYGPRASRTLKTLRERGWKAVKPSQWINIGIVLCFFGSIIDNAYWLIPWSLKYAGYEYGALFNDGVFVNVPFRQLPLIVGGALHILAESLSHKSRDKMKARLVVFWRVFWISSLVGFIFVSWLTFLKYR